MTPAPGKIRKLLIANRGEISIRIARTAAELGMQTVAICSREDADSAHVAHADLVHTLEGAGVQPYLDIEQLVSAAQAHGCDAVHPGYGFLSESVAFARRCEEVGLKFVGPRPELIDLFGDKARARETARSCGVPLMAGTSGATTLDEARAFFDCLPAGGALMVKALSGGGGRGIRIVQDAADLAAAFERCRFEAGRYFGNDAVYVERFIPRARHVEVQVAGDGRVVTHLWERECTLQRQHQKLLEIAPSPSLSDKLRHRILDSACRIAVATGYDNIGTVEFLIDLDQPEDAPESFAFIEVNPRLQVEHTVTEEILGVDLVGVQLALAAGHSLADLSLRQETLPTPRGYAMQLRVNLESTDQGGNARPTQGTISELTLPGGPGVRVDTFAYSGYTTVTHFDSLLAKLVISTPERRFDALLARARRAVAECSIRGVTTNLPLLRALLAHPAVAANEVTTRFIAERAAELVPALSEPSPLVAQPSGLVADIASVAAPLSGVVASVAVQPGDRVSPGTCVAVIEAMKMEHLVTAVKGGIVHRVLLEPGHQVEEGETMLHLSVAEHEQETATSTEEIDPDHIRSDLAALQAHLDATLDHQRPQAVERRRRRGQRTIRENIDDLCDDGSLVEYGQLALAFQRSRRTPEELWTLSPADGLVMGIASINGAAFGPKRSKVAVAGYDATVFAGTQGHTNHKKTDRLFDLAREQSLPLVLFAEGGGGRPGEDSVSVAGLQTQTFLKLAQLSGKVPVVGVVSGRCFAGNAALLGLSDVIIATENTNIGMGGPALIEAAGLGTFTPEDVGPVSVQAAGGVVDIRVADDEAAVAAAKQYLSYFQGPMADWEATDQRQLRHLIPENRLRVYDVRQVLETLADKGSCLELKGDFGQGFVTALIRIQGRPLGVMANNPLHLAGAIDADGADKAARFMRLCNAHGLPILSLIDTPGIMVGPDAEATALVRHAARLFAAAAQLSVPLFALVLRKAYGLGAMASAGGHFHVPFVTAAWPTGELGGMGFEGAVRLGYKRELEAIEDPVERKAWFDAKVAALYEKGKATSAASYYELDAVIDPADTRHWLITAFDATASDSVPHRPAFIDTW